MRVCGGHADPSQVPTRMPDGPSDMQHQPHRHGVRGITHWRTIKPIGRRVGTHGRASSRPEARVLGGASRLSRVRIWAADRLRPSQSRSATRTAQPRQRQLDILTSGRSMPSPAAGSACDVGVRAGAEDGHFACAVGTGVRAESPCGRQTVSATHTTSCIQLEHVASLIGARPRRLVAASATPAALSGCQSACV